MKCLYGCAEYGKNAACPPNAPPVDACARFFREYRRAVVFHFAKTLEKPEDRHAWSRKINLESPEARQARCSRPASSRPSCCPWTAAELLRGLPGVRTACKELKLSRPSPDALAMDVYSTVRKIGYPIEVLSDYGQEMNRYAFLLVD